MSTTVNTWALLHTLRWVRWQRTPFPPLPSQTPAARQPALRGAPLGPERDGHRTAGGYQPPARGRPRTARCPSGTARQPAAHRALLRAAGRACTGRHRLRCPSPPTPARTAARGAQQRSGAAAAAPPSPAGSGAAPPRYAEPSGGRRRCHSLSPSPRLRLLSRSPAGTVRTTFPRRAPLRCRPGLRRSPLPAAHTRARRGGQAPKAPQTRPNRRYSSFLPARLPATPHPLRAERSLRRPGGVRSALPTGGAPPAAGTSPAGRRALRTRPPHRRHRRTCARAAAPPLQCRPPGGRGRAGTARPSPPPPARCRRRSGDRRPRRPLIGPAAVSSRHRPARGPRPAAAPGLRAAGQRPAAPPGPSWARRPPRTAVGSAAGTARGVCPRPPPREAAS
ncbi:basic proline-rich protein-like [Prinia subflava]|uniref:basic proline-rich protein-like n=1 Tax=Prinia subflava TaxID=208062 RepID=UPI002FE08DB1